MTEKELASLYYINIELERIKKNIENLKSKLRELSLVANVKAISYSGIPNNNVTGNPTQNTVLNYMILQEELRCQLDDNLERYAVKQLEFEKQKADIEEYIDCISDTEVQVIFKYRCIERKSWGEIGAILSMDRRTASRKYYGYINSHNN